jgi:hypothetical protein
MNGKYMPLATYKERDGMRKSAPIATQRAIFLVVMG